MTKLNFLRQQATQDEVHITIAVMALSHSSDALLHPSHERPLLLHGRNNAQVFHGRAP